MDAPVIEPFSHPEDRYVFFSSPELLARSLADDLVRFIRSAVSARGVCHMVIPGGSSPCRTLEMLKDREVPWEALHLYPSDERCLPCGAAMRNDHMHRRCLLEHVSGMRHRYHPIPAELGPKEGARLYRRLLDRTPRFDLVLLGVGPDGHTASLFPLHAALGDPRSAVPIRDAPKPPAQRVSIGIKRLADAANRVVLLVGSDKRHLLQASDAGLLLPVHRMRPAAWYVHPIAHP